MLVCLLSLLEGPKSGYAIGRRIKELSGGRLKLNQGSIYQNLKAYVNRGFVEPLHERPRLAPRPFRITEFGQDVILAEYERMKQAQQVLEEILNSPQ